MASTSTTAADEAGTSGEVAVRPRRALEELWDETFVRDLPADPCSDNIPRQVLHACYTKVSPTAPIDSPKLVAWSPAVADLLDLDHKERKISASEDLKLEELLLMRRAVGVY